MEFLKWTKIEQFHHVRARVMKSYQRSSPSSPIKNSHAPIVQYFAKVKLDGTNAAVRIGCDGELRAQSRTRFVTPDDDNYGFAAWVESNRDEWSKIKVGFLQGFMTIYGEWAGSGVQKRTSVSKLERAFYVYAIVHADDEIVCKPSAIERTLAPVIAMRGLHVLPYCGKGFSVDFMSASSLAAFVDDVNELCSSVEECDPYVAETFGVKGTGEGIVLYPQGYGNYELASELMFKVKGEKHETVRQKKPAVMDPETAESIDEFAKKFVTTARLEQGLEQACGGVVDVKKTGDFLKWIVNDVESESSAELEASGMTWKQASKAVMVEARRWWIGRVGGA